MNIKSLVAPKQACRPLEPNVSSRRPNGADERTKQLLAALAVALAVSSSVTSAAVPLADQADATRLLEQTTFGPNDALVDHVQSVGIHGWLSEQFAAPASQYPAFSYVPTDAAGYCATNSNPHCFRDNYSLFLLQNAFFRNALTGPDQLRQRVAFALSQIFVTSGVVVKVPYGMARYQQIFLDNAFGNFEQLMTKVTLSSVMGDYLDMVNNDKPAAGVNPNENYARELMQLFSIGVWELKHDGTQLLGPDGSPIPSYDQDTIESFAHIFTGFTYPLLPGTAQRKHNPKNYLGDMVGVENNHDAGAKSPLLDGVSLPGGQPMQVELVLAIHNIFIHPNVGPFIGKQLIQKLVTGNPSPQYVARVAAAFANNGGGVRGDMGAVVLAVLLDPDARGTAKTDAHYGKLREPVLYVTGASRAVEAVSDGVFLAEQARNLGEDLFNAPSVFNYYPPTYVVPGTAVLGPEFALQNASTAINRYNFANAFAFGSIAPLSTLPGAIGTQPNWSSLQAKASNPEVLVGALDALLMDGTMPAAMKATLLAAIAAVPASDPLTRAKTAFYLTITSPQYQVER